MRLAKYNAWAVLLFLRKPYCVLLMWSSILEAILSCMIEAQMLHNMFNNEMGLSFTNLFVSSFLKMLATFASVSSSGIASTSQHLLNSLAMISMLSLLGYL